MDKTALEELRKKYMDNPPEGISASEIKTMTEDDLLDMDYFLHENVFGEDF